MWKNVSGSKVDFDLSVIVEESNEDGSSKGIGMKINIFSGGINKEQKELQKNQSTQRIQFAVFINEEKKEGIE